jgi:2-dehydropantoate 2-reductase
MAPRIGIFGAGAVGGYVGGVLALAGQDVTLIGQWPEHVEQVKHAGLRLTGTQGERLANPTIIHLHEVQGLWRRKLDLVFLCVKSYDTAWAATMIAPYLTPTGCIVSMQNGMNEDAVAVLVGTDRTLGVVLNTIGVNNIGPGIVTRTTHPGGAAHTVFRVGELDGRKTSRACNIAALLSSVDSATVTDNLRGERWSKLVTNSISHGLSGATGLTSRGLLGSIALRRIIVQLAAEGVAVGQALGYSLVDIYGTAPATWTAAGAGDAAACATVERSLLRRLERLTDDERPSLAQDMLRGRRTEIDFTSGLIVARGEQQAIATPTQAAVLEIVQQVERGDIAAGPETLGAAP